MQHPVSGHLWFSRVRSYPVAYRFSENIIACFHLIKFICCKKSKEIYEISFPVILYFFKFCLSLVVYTHTKRIVVLTFSEKNNKHVSIFLTLYKLLFFFFLICCVHKHMKELFAKACTERSEIRI